MALKKAAAGTTLTGTLRMKNDVQVSLEGDTHTAGGYVVTSDDFYEPVLIGNIAGLEYASRINGFPVLEAPMGQYSVGDRSLNSLVDSQVDILAK